MQFIYHFCVMISTDNTTVVSYISKQGRTHPPNLCMEVWEILHLCLEHNITLRVRHISGKCNILVDRLSRLDKPSARSGPWIKQLLFFKYSISPMWICLRIDSIKLPLYVSSVLDNQALAIDALSMNWNNLMLSHQYLDTFYSGQNTSVSVQNSSNRYSLASTSMALRGITTANISSVPSPILSKTANTSKRKVLLSKPPKSCSSRLGVIKQSVGDKTFRKTLQNLSPDLEHLLLKVYDAKWVIYSNWCHRKKVNSVTASLNSIADFLLYPFLPRKNVL